MWRVMSTGAKQFFNGLGTGTAIGGLTVGNMGAGVQAGRTVDRNLHNEDKMERDSGDTASALAALAITAKSLSHAPLPLPARAGVSIAGSIIGGGVANWLSDRGVKAVDWAKKTVF